MYYVILGDQKSNFKSPDIQQYHTYLGGSLRGYFDEYNHFRVIPKDIFHIYSDDGKLEVFTGVRLNEAISLVGYDNFLNMNDKGFTALPKLHIQTPELSAVSVNRSLYIAYKGYIHCINVVSFIRYLALMDNLLFVSTKGAINLNSYMFSAEGLVGTPEGVDFVSKYTGGAGAALCKQLI